MGVRALSMLLPFACAPAGSFVLPSTCRLSSTARRQQPRCEGNFNGGAATSSAQPASPAWSYRGSGPGVSMVLNSTQRESRSSATTLRSLPEQAAASAQGIAVSDPGEPGPEAVEELPEFISNDAVSYWVHPGKESNIWLVGTIHRTAPSVKLVKEVIGGVKPEVVMVELCSERINLLPPGEAMATRSGLWWWSPYEQPEGDTDEGAGDEGEEDGDGEDTNEITVAVREAGTCGARVLLGDREYQTTATMLGKAKRVDMASAKERESFKEMTDSFDCEESTRAITRKECEQMKATAPKVFAVMCTTRDQVMAKHLMKLRGSQTTVAVFGMAHLDGVEKVLKGHGWKRQRQRA
eukprot:g2075.t1